MSAVGPPSLAWGIQRGPLSSSLLPVFAFPLHRPSNAFVLITRQYPSARTSHSRLRSRIPTSATKLIGNTWRLFVKVLGIL
ncbi:hypothetical protein QC762_0101310 [Podospora pseudocomata]|uniref:Secreted protein n=1 Tax=Podospora pseudocomata TaxID=2093779 RepID=A0ABR0G928_9PEZI|nr:hypothetical protein QC762_0101310 [Podospora pseudocomata]